MPTDQLSLTLSALADPTRRGILARLAQGEATVSELAKPYDMSMAAVSKHLKVLEQARLISRGRQSQWRPCKLEAGPIREVSDFVEVYRRHWEQSLDRLDAYLAEMQRGDPDAPQELTQPKETIMADLTIEAPKDEPIIIMTRTFDAPRELVWKALSEPEHAVRWWGPHSHKNKVLKWDWRVGGEWSIESTMPDGEKIVFFGEYREIERPRTVTQTFSFDRLPPGAHSLDTVVLEEHDGKTVYHATSRLYDLESRDAMLASGMEVGVVEGFERLDAMLEAFKATTAT